MHTGSSIEILGWAVLAGLAALGVWMVLIYNRLIRLKHNVRMAWSNIDVLLKQRHDELPKLIEVCKAYMKHEQDTLEKVTLARARANTAREQEDVAGVGEAETLMRQGLGRLFALSESYPDLKADRQFRHLSGRISELENSIADRREFYNEAANINNIRLEEFPNSFIASLFNFEKARLLRFDAAALADVDVKALLQA